jgi:hypothetical protein
MTYDEQTDALNYELLGVVTRYMSEFDLNEATIVGVLESVKGDIMEAWTDFDADFEIDTTDDITDIDTGDDTDLNDRGGFYKK